MESVESRERRVRSGEWKVRSGKRRAASQEWRVESREWRVESGEWRVLTIGNWNVRTLYAKGKAAQAANVVKERRFHIMGIS